MHKNRYYSQNEGFAIEVTQAEKKTLKKVEGAHHVQHIDIFRKLGEH